MPTKKIKTKLKGNTPDKNSQPDLDQLANDLFAIGYVAEQLYRKLLPGQENEKQAIGSFIAGCLSGIGKIAYQEADLSCGEISSLIYQCIDSESLTKINPSTKKSIKHVVYWHNEKPLRKESFSTYADIYKKLKKIPLPELVESSVGLLKKISEIEKKYKNNDPVISKIFNEGMNMESLHSSLPNYKNYSVGGSVDEYPPQIEHNAINNVMLACVSTAIQIISRFGSALTKSHIESNLLYLLVDEHLFLKSNFSAHANGYLDSFPDSERSKKQSQVAEQLSNVNGVAILAGPSGCGKTKAAIKWAKSKAAQQLIFVCPKTQVCQALFHEMVLGSYKPDGKIEINTGDFKFTNKWGIDTPEPEYFSGDIVITTIDQVLNGITGNKRTSLLIKFMNAHVIFDDFHEYAGSPIINLLFAELVSSKARQNASNTLLLSAAPSYIYLEKLLMLSKRQIVRMPSFNRSAYQLKFEVFDESKRNNENPLYRKHDHDQNNSTIVISNTAIAAQRSFIVNEQQENSILLHSKFKKTDKSKIFNDILQSFGKSGTRKIDVLRGSPITQSLNISCEAMVSEITTAENFLLRLGRLDRFGLSTKVVSTLCVAIPESVQRNKKLDAARFMAESSSLPSAVAWKNLLESGLGEKEFYLSDIYDLYEKLYQSDVAIKAISSDLLAALIKSTELINQKIIEPVAMQENRQASKTWIKKCSLRGENRFVQMAVCDVNDYRAPIFVDRYAYEMIEDGEQNDNLIVSVNEILGYGEGAKNLLVYMQSHHHKIMGGPKGYKDFIRLNAARSADNPVFLSYTPSGLEMIGGARHDYAIYYAVCDKQPIGAISIEAIKQLKNKPD